MWRRSAATTVFTSWLMATMPCSRSLGLPALGKSCPELHLGDPVALPLLDLPEPRAGLCALNDFGNGESGSFFGLTPSCSSRDCPALALAPGRVQSGTGLVMRVSEDLFRVVSRVI